MDKLPEIRRANLNYDDVLIVPQYSQISSRSLVSTKTKLGPIEIEKPIIAANMDTICGYEMAAEMEALGGLGIIHRYQTLEQYEEILKKSTLSRLAMSVGTLANDKDRIDLVMNRAPIICIDIAHGDCKQMEQTIKYIRKNAYDTVIIAGNVCTPDATERLRTWGADVVKVGVANGHVCETRRNTGVGYPQFDTVRECANEVNWSNISIIADGGIRAPGDVSKAIGAGAHAVMIGSYLSGSDKVPGWTHPGCNLSYRGMASAEARTDFGQKAKFVEGRSVAVFGDVEGSTAARVTALIEGLQSAMAYTGADSIRDFHRDVEFVAVK
jgi:IMP dehydrogenase